MALFGHRNKAQHLRFEKSEGQRQSGDGEEEWSKVKST